MIKSILVESLIYVKKIMARDGFLSPVNVLLSEKEFYRAYADVKRYVQRFIAEALHRRRQCKGDSLLQEKAPKEFNLLDRLTETPTT